jgi:hypothetical protein
MFLNILLDTFIVFLIFFIIVLVSPFSFILQYNRDSGEESALARMYWLHPWVLCGLFDLKKKLLDIRLFGRFIIYSKDVDKKQNDGAAEVGENVPAGPLHAEADSPRKETHTDAVYETAGSAHRTEHVHSESRGPGKPGVAPFGEDRKKKEGPIAKLRSMREKIKNSSLQKVLFFLRQEAWRHKILSWLVRTISPFSHLFTMHRLMVHVRAGLLEPSTTGKLYGYWMGISHALMLDTKGKREMVFEPVFNKDCLEVDGNLCIRTSLLRFMVPVVIMVVTFPYFSTFRVWYASRKIGQKEKLA